jgi:hypothetical protein
MKISKKTLVWFLCLFTGIGAMSVLLITAPALAVHNDGTFEIDGDVIPNSIPNAVDSTGTPGPDWQTLFTCTASGCTQTAAGAAASAAFVLDPAPLSIFTGGGSKDQQNLDQWQWKDGSVPDKDNLTSAFAAILTDTNGHRILYFGADRLANNGDAQIGFWFFRNTVKAVGGVFVDENGNPATHAVGDILVLSNFTNGGTATNITVYEVSGFNNDGTVAFQVLAQGSANQPLACAGDFACAATNPANTTALGPYYVPKSGTPGVYPAESFFEGGLDLTGLNLDNECFPGFLVETRSSQSITATLKDFTLKELQKCEASITTDIFKKVDSTYDGPVTGTTLPANTTIRDTATVTGVAGFPTPTGNVTFNYFTNNTCTAPADSSETVALTNGVANSSDVTPLPGKYSFNASYGGDGLYPAVGPSDCEPIEISKFDSAVNTRILLGPDFVAEVTNQAINLQGNADVAVKDEATVTGAGPTPTGNVTFSRFTNGGCTGTASTESVALVNGKALSSQFLLGPNILSYIAVYGGDSNYNGSANSKCEPACAFTFTSSQ